MNGARMVVVDSSLPLCFTRGQVRMAGDTAGLERSRGAGLLRIEAGSLYDEAAIEVRKEL